MEILLVLLIVGLGGLWYFTTRKPSTNTTETNPPATEEKPVEKPAEPTVAGPLDVNQDGKVDIKDAVEVVKKARGRAKKAADLDGDGKVTVKDAKVAVRKTRAKVVETVAKTRGRSKKA